MLNVVIYYFVVAHEHNDGYLVHMHFEMVQDIKFSGLTIVFCFNRKIQGKHYICHLIENTHVEDYCRENI